MKPITELDTLFIGRNLLLFETLDSTNSYALSLLNGAKKIPEGTVIKTREQRAGRGQAFTRWHSEPSKNLLISLILYPHFINPTTIFLLSQCISLGIRDALKEILQQPVSIKWPNDIYVGDKKICGLLIENSVKSMHINHSVVGIGLNVNQVSFPTILPNPVSIRNISGEQFEIDQVLNAVCNHIEKRYLQLKAGYAEQIKSDYRESMYRFNEFHQFEFGSQRFSAKIIDVADDGKLVLQYDNKLTGRYDFKSIHFVLDES